MWKRVLFNIIFCLLAGLVIFPAAQHRFHWINSVGLYGAANTDTILAKLTLKSWFNDSFQQSANNYAANTIGLRSNFIRMHNTIEFLLFGNTPAAVVIGKNHDLHGAEYIGAFLGRNYMGDTQINAGLLKVKHVQDALDKKGKKLIVVYAPSKARYASHNIPDSFFHFRKDKSNHEEMVRIGDSLGIRQINVDGWFKSINTPGHPLFARSGIHWTYYGATLVADSIHKLIKKNGIYIPEMSWDEGEETGPENQEWDMEQILNLPFRININQKFLHPAIRYQHDSTQKKPHIIYIGDSFVWTLLFCGIPQNESSSYQYWSYYNEVWSSKHQDKVLPINEIDPMKEMMDADCIILLFTDINLQFIGNGFIDDAYDYFKSR